MTVEFELTDMQRMLQEGARTVAKNVIRPLSLQMEKDKRVPDEILLQLQQLGASQSGVPKEVGTEQPNADKKPSSTQRTVLVAGEEMAWGDASVLLSMPGPGLGGPPVRSHGTKEQQERFFGIFKDLTQLRWGAYGLTEPGAGSDVAGIRSTCRKEGKEWVINGRKCFITNGARASWVSVFATVDPSLGRAGHRVFIVEKGTPGFTIGKIEDKLGLRASETAELVFEDCRVPEENLLGGEDRYAGGNKEGFVAAMKTFDSSRPMVGILAIGIGRAAYEHTRDFVKANYMLSRPIPRYRVLADRLARVKRKLDAARLLCWHAAWMGDHHMPNAKEASMAKAAGAQAAVHACVEAIEIVGAHACLEDGEHALLAKWFRDIKVFDIFEGTGQIQRVVISKRLFEGLRGF